MALHAVDLLTPRGRLNGAALWPGVVTDVVEESLEAFLDEGYGLAVGVSDPDEAARLWAYYRAWDETHQRLLAMPSSVQTSDQGSASYLQVQITEFGRLAAGAKVEFDALVAEAAGTVTEWPVITSLR